MSYPKSSKESITVEKSYSELQQSIDISNINEEDFNKERIIKGIEKRIVENRPNLFDLLFINSGRLSTHPLICSSYCLFDQELVKKYFNIEKIRSIEHDDYHNAIENAKWFLNDEDEKISKYWRFAILLMEDQVSEPQANDLLIPILDDLNKFLDVHSVDEIEAAFIQLRDKHSQDLPEFQEFYKQLIRYVGCVLAKSWFDKFHNELLQKVRRSLPKRSLIKVPEGDISFLTKAQRKYREAMLQQEKITLNIPAIKYFDLKHLIRYEDPKKMLGKPRSNQGLQYWGDQEFEFNDRIELNIEDTHGMFMPNYEAIVYKGIDWNQHNRVRYTPENPPPPTIRGYKFSIFYPQLEGCLSMPTFILDKKRIDPKDGPDPNYKYIVIIFKAKPPYLPIAFRIVDKPWDQYRNGGYFASFDSGIFTFQIVFMASLYFKGSAPEQLY